MQKKYRVQLSPAQRSELNTFVRTGKRAAQAIHRARILLLADENGEALHDGEIARILNLNRHTVENNRKRFSEHGLQAVLERKQRKDKGIPQKVDGRVEAQLITLACSETPNGEPAWTLQMLGDEVVRLGLVDSISRESVRKTLKKRRLDHT